MAALAFQKPTSRGAHLQPTRGLKPVRRQVSTSLGNQSQLRRLQAKLQVGAVDHPLEREADAVADRVMRLPAAGFAVPNISAGGQGLSRKCAQCEEEESLRRKTDAGEAVAPGALDLVGATLGQPGAPLDARSRSFFEPRFGQDFAHVRVHTDPAAAASARAVSARAYTVGSHLVFAQGQYAPSGDAGQRLIAHELAHTVQQGGGAAAGAGRSPEALGLLQRDGPDVPLKEAKKEDATNAVTGGLKTVADEAGKNEKLKTYGLDLAKRYALPIWSGASDADKAAIIAGGAAIYGTGVGALAADPLGRKTLSGVNFIAPLGLLPYATLTGFSFDLPKTKTEPILLHFSFKGDDLLDLAHQKLSYAPPLTLGFDMTLSVGPDGKVTTPFALAKFGVLPGVTVAGGFGVATDLPQLVSPGAGQPLAPLKTFPQPAQPAPPAGAAVFVSVDLLKAPILPKAVRSALGGDPDKK